MSTTQKKILSRRASEAEESVTLAMTAKANAMREAGLDVISFSAGEPDFDTPEHIKKAAADALAKGQTKYTPASWLLALRKAVAAKFKKDNGLDYDPAQVVVSCGAKHSLYNVMQAVLEEGDEAIIPAPYWVSYPAMVKCAGATPVIVNTTEKNGLKMTAA